MNFEYFADWPPALFYFGVFIPAIALYLFGGSWLLEKWQRRRER